MTGDIKVVVHIGSPKTGSSSIQRALFYNSQILLEAGIYYQPPSGFDHCKTITQIVSEKNQKPNKKELKKFLRDQIEAARSHNCTTVIVSSECLMGRPAWVAESFHEFLAQHDLSTTVICFLRNIGDYYLAAWQQWYFKDPRYLDFDDFVDKYSDPKSWPEKLSRWDAVASQDLSVGPFAKDYFEDGELISEFCKRALLPDDLPTLEFSASRNDIWSINSSFNAFGVRLLELLRDEAGGDIHNHELQKFLSVELAELVNGGARRQLNKRQAAKINDNFKTVIAKLASISKVNKMFYKAKGVNSGEANAIDDFNLSKSLICYLWRRSQS